MREGKTVGRLGAEVVDIGRSLFLSIGKYQGRFGQMGWWALEMVGWLQDRRVVQARGI